MLRISLLYVSSPTGCGLTVLLSAFLDQPEDEDTPRKKKKPVVSTKRVRLLIA
mgnify:CR=1 FL=1